MCPARLLREAAPLCSQGSPGWRGAQWITQPSHSPRWSGVCVCVHLAVVGVVEGKVQVPEWAHRQLAARPRTHLRRGPGRCYCRCSGLAAVLFCPVETPVLSCSVADPMAVAPMAPPRLGSRPAGRAIAQDSTSSLTPHCWCRAATECLLVSYGNDPPPSSNQTAACQKAVTLPHLHQCCAWDAPCPRSTAS